MKKLIALSSMLLAATMFTACGDDDSNSSGASSSLKSCDVIIKASADDMDLYSSHYCAEGEYKTAEQQSVYAKECKDRNEIVEGVSTTVTVKKGSGCPSGYVIKCEDKASGETDYYYDEDSKGKSCEELDREDEDDDDDDL